MIDDDTYELNDKIVTSSNIQFLKVDKQICIQQGFKNCNLIYTNKYLLNNVGLPSVDTLVIAWDKAIFYFTRINTKYDFIWFIEDGKYKQTINNTYLKVSVVLRIAYNSIASRIHQNKLFFKLKILFQNL